MSKDWTVLCYKPVTRTWGYCEMHSFGGPARPDAKTVNPTIVRVTLEKATAAREAHGPIEAVVVHADTAEVALAMLNSKE